MLQIQNISKNQGQELLYDGMSFQVNEGDKVGLVGANGTGKSTLFKMIVGLENIDQGEISFPSQRRLSYFSQDVGELKDVCALDFVMAGDEELLALKDELKKLENQLMEPMSDEEMNKVLERLGDVQTDFEKRAGYDLESRAEEVLTGLGIMPEFHQKKMHEFSGGQKMRIALAQSLVVFPDLIIMDEPTNYLDMESILWLEQWLQEFKGAVLMATHDRDFMNNVCNRIVELANRQANLYSGNYEFYLQERVVRRDQLLKEQKKQQESIAKDEEFIAKFKARASHAAQVQSRVKKLEKIKRVEVPDEASSIAFDFKAPQRGGDDVAQIKNLAHSYGDFLVFKDLTTTIRRQEKIAVVGVNGAGKSTFLKCVAKQITPTHGSAEIGPSISMGYFGQFSYENLNPNNTILQEAESRLSHFSDGQIRNLLGAFQFQGDDVAKKISYLSGGERSRVVLACLLSAGHNFLILDEPTNHLDILSREMLLSALQKFEGTLLFVSHDRHFLRSLSNLVYEVSRKEIVIHPRTYAEYESMNH